MPLIHIYAPNAPEEPILELGARALLSVLGIPLLVLREDDLPPWLLLETFEEFQLSLMVNTAHPDYCATARACVVRFFSLLSARHVPSRYLLNPRSRGKVSELPNAAFLLEAMFYQEN